MYYIFSKRLHLRIASYCIGNEIQQSLDKFCFSIYVQNAFWGPSGGFCRLSILKCTSIFWTDARGAEKDVQTKIEKCKCTKLKY